ncbi:hypothetical protein FA15DRAFT_220330 [Coprinopsis marcescibilis]|uniref:F-box domain-containing protein n=1 Tax=Coprinopsis marcescibilis TaxID=230819 RepID=A0A5C3L2S9_COPMA|nr:hypothetical protein FA15DRAFT_220330 [Coprinopsis marcescibilis]
MLYRPTNLSHKESRLLEPTDFTQKSLQDGSSLQHDASLLLDVPVEILNRITSSLDPYALFALSLARKYLYEHIENENTWRHAFVSQFLGIGPEGDIEDSRAHMMLRRTSSSWKTEYIVRYDLTRRWSSLKTSSGAVAHSPLQSAISSMHLLEPDALLCASIQYGVVSRSLPLTGKVLSGYLDAAGSINGRGLGNPNAEFTPNVSACSIVPDGGTVRILWGYRNGMVSFMTTTKTMDATRRALSEFTPCRLRDQHDSTVNNVVWLGAAGGWLGATAGQDGRVRLWDSKTGYCLWASEQKLRITDPEPFTKIVGSFGGRFIAALTRSGDIVMWTGFNFQDTDTGPHAVVTIPCPYSSPTPGEVPSVLAFYAASSSLTPAILVAFQDDQFFHRVNVTGTTESSVIIFGTPSLGAISAITPYFAATSAESSLVITGDRLGCVSVYNWNAESTGGPIAPMHKFEAFRDGSAVTSVAWNGVTLMAGSSRGDTHVFDGLSFERLKKFSSPAASFPRRGANPNRGQEAVHHLLVGPNKDTLFVGVGDRVLAWKAGPMKRMKGLRTRRAPGTSPKKTQQNGPSKMSRQLEIRHELSEFKALTKEEGKRNQLRSGRQSEHRAQLNELGLSESEALEYVLMMSRDEVPAVGLGPSDALTEEELAAALEEGAFQLEDDDGLEPFASGSGSIVSVSGYVSTSPSHRSTTTSPTVRPILRLTPPPTTPKVQVSPRYVREPMAAGLGESITPLSLSPQIIPLDDDEHFPPVGSGSVSPASSFSPASSRRNSNTSSLDFHLRPAKSAWNTPFALSAAGGSGLAARLSQSPPGAVDTPSRVVSSGSGGLDEIDEDLRFALELSLAEARSRGEDV